MPRFWFLVLILAAFSILPTACQQAAPTPTQKPAAPTQAAAAAPTTAPAASTQPSAAPTKVTQPTAAPSPAQPTAAPAKKVDFPQKGKTITMIVGYSAGGATDIGARLLAAGMEKVLGVPIQVVNKAGATGQMAYTDLAQAKPDGYTIAMTVLPAALTTYMDPRRKAAYGRKSFQPVALHVVEPTLVAVRGDGPHKGIKDLLDAAKAKPETVKAGTSGIGGTPHLAILRAEKMSGAKFATVHFEGNAPATAALLGGHIDADWSAAGHMIPQVKTGEIRMLAIMDKEQSKFYPGVRTMAEQGYPMESAASRGIVAPAGTPREIVDILADSIKKTMEMPDHKQKMDDSALTLRFMGPDQFGAYWSEGESQLTPILDLLIAAG